VSEAQRLVIERVIRAKLRADAADAWLDRQPVETRLDSRVLAIDVRQADALASPTYWGQPTQAIPEPLSNGAWMD